LTQLTGGEYQDHFEEYISFIIFLREVLSTRRRWSPNFSTSLAEQPEGQGDDGNARKATAACIGGAPAPGIVG
jgi:hypothetical protein